MTMSLYLEELFGCKMMFPFPCVQYIRRESYLLYIFFARVRCSFSLLELGKTLLKRRNDFRQ